MTVVKCLKLDWNCIRLWILELRSHEWKPLFAPTVLAVSLSSENREEWIIWMSSFESTVKRSESYYVDLDGRQYNNMPFMSRVSTYKVIQPLSDVHYSFRAGDIVTLA